MRSRFSCSSVNKNNKLGLNTHIMTLHKKCSFPFTDETLNGKLVQCGLGSCSNKAHVPSFFLFLLVCFIRFLIIL